MDKTKNEKKYNTVESFFTNIMLLLGLQQIGGGLADCQVLITSFATKSFGRIENKVGQIIDKISKRSMVSAIDDEIRLMRSSDEYTKWKNHELPAQANRLTVCYDMGWNKRSSGNRYDSVSGHSIIIGAHSKKVLNFRPVSKCCMFCKVWKKKNGEKIVPNHPCTKNYLGSSKSMESEAILWMAKDCWNHKRFHIKTVVADDDSTMKKILRHNYDKLVADGKMKRSEVTKTSGWLLSHVTEPTFLADFNHQVKLVGRALYSLVKMKLADSTVNSLMTKRKKLYWPQMLNQIKHLDITKDWETIQKRVSAPVEHIFNCQKYCDIAWCYSLQAV